jgi:hypothetical protein
LLFCGPALYLLQMQWTTRLQQPSKEPKVDRTTRRSRLNKEGRRWPCRMSLEYACIFSAVWLRWERAARKTTVSRETSLSRGRPEEGLPLVFLRSVHLAPTVKGRSGKAHAFFSIRPCQGLKAFDTPVPAVPFCDPPVSNSWIRASHPAA